MKILAIDSSGMTASAAVMEDEVLTAEYTIHYKKTHSQTLLPMIAEITEMLQLDLGGIDAIAVAGGPGSFTGLRIGSATAKGLGLALKKPIVSVPTLEGMAMHFCCSDGLICPMMDARRQQVYTGIYRFSNGKMEIVEDQTAVPVETIIARLNELGEKVILLGDGVPAYREQLVKGLSVAFQLAPAHMNQQSAACVAARAAEYLRDGSIQTAAEHEPDYLRVSQAERERNERLQKEKELQS